MVKVTWGGTFTVAARSVYVSDTMEKWTVSQLKVFLKDRGVEYGSRRKNELLELCLQAVETNIDVDPDGLNEDLSGIIAAKLRLDNGDYLSQPFSCDGDSNISFVPAITVLDIYNYLMTFSQYNHATLRDYKKLEGYTMYVDSYVVDVQCVRWPSVSDYVAVKGKVKPRTNDKDPSTKLGFYSLWVIFCSSSISIKSAYCTCKGGYVFFPCAGNVAG